MEGRSLYKRPPLLCGTEYTDYMYWKLRMRTFIQAMDYQMWMMIVNGPHNPTKIVNGQKVDKQPDEWDDNDLRLLQLEARAVNVLYCGLDHNAFASVFRCDSAKAIWNTLELFYEGNNKVKAMKTRLLQADYDAFTMKPNESINDMFSRFLHITNALESLGMSLSDDELVNKILRSLSRTWTPKLASILEVKEHNRMSMHELISYLVARERRMTRAGKKEQIVCYHC